MNGIAQNSAKSGAIFYRPDIDGLRAIAVLGVLAFHSGLPGFPGGFVGVDVFFVISGYLITGLLSAEFESTGRIDLRAFFVRRIRRLLPALALVVLATLAIAFVTMFPLELHRLGKAAQAVAVLAANFHFKNFTGGYFDPSTDVMPLLHTWSLAVEEQYYLVWPGLFLLIHRLWRPRDGNVHLSTVIALLCVFVVSLSACVWMTGHDRLAAFYLTPYRAWEFALGALVSHATAWLQKRQTAATGNLLAAAGLAAILGAMCLFDDRVPFPGIAALLPAAGAAAVIAGGLAPGARLPTVLLGNRLMVGIGLISYSLYLWHWPLLALARDHALGQRDLTRDLAILACAFPLAWLTYLLVENPIRRNKPGPFRTRKGTFRVGFLISLLVVAAANGTMEWGKYQNAWYMAQHGELGNRESSLMSGCTQQAGEEALGPASGCSVGATDGPYRLLTWGDSHTGHLVPMLHDVSSKAGIRTIVRASGACPPLDGAIPYKRDEGQFACAHFNSLVMREILREAKHELRGVVLSARWNFYLALPVTEPGGTYPFALARNWRAIEHDKDRRLEVGLPPLDTAGSTAALETSLQDTLRQLTAAGLRIVIVAPVPELYFSGPQCLYRRTAEECTVPRHRVEDRRRLALAALRNAAAGLDGVRIYDPIEEFCDARTCYAQREQRMLYGDSNHITPDTARLLGKRMQKLLDWASGID